MKFLSFTFIFLCSVVNIYGQLPAKEYSAGAAASDNSIRTAYLAGNYDSALHYVAIKMKLFETLTDADKKSKIKDQINSYYALACLYALKGDKIQALDALEKSAGLGLKSYRHVMADKDLTAIRNEKRFSTITERIKANSDYIKILRENGKYTPEDTRNYPVFTYASHDDYRLRNVKQYFNLDSIAGKGDEIDKIIKLMTWVNHVIKHSPHWPFCEIDAIDIYNYHKTSGRGVNCRAIATVLNECYLSMGIKSRIVGCIPADKSDNESHVINSVYSQTLKKWLWIDPTNNAFITDDAGNMLGIAEVRDRLIRNKPLALGKTCTRTIEEYLYEYMAKNLFRFHCNTRAGFNVETNYRETAEIQVQLIPEGYDIKSVGTTFYATSDDAYFWQSPPAD